MKFNKKFLSIFFIAFIAIALIGCDGADTFLTDETTEDTQQTTSEGTTSEDGTTTTEETTLPVDLTALIDQLKVEYADTLENENFLATEDLNLLTSIDGIDITWTSSNTDYLENDGTIHRPSYSVGDQTVVLTATVTDGTDTESYGFFVTIKALDKTDQERADEVFEVVTAFPNKEKWSSADSDALDFLIEGEDYDEVTYAVTWTSSHPDIISTDGTITQPEGADVDVTMTATITIGGVDYSKDVVFTVAMLEEGTEVSTIAEAIAMGQDAYVEILGVTVIAMYDSGDVFFTDGTDILYIYSPPFTVQVGDVLDISGIVDFYYNAPQLAGSDTQPLKAVESSAAATSAPVTTGMTVESAIADLTMPSTENPHEYKKYEITASVYYDESWGNYSVFLVPTTYDFDQVLGEDATQPAGSSIMIYYRSDMDVLKSFHGQEVTIEIIMQGYRTDKSVFYANFFGTPMDVGITIDDDAEAVNTALSVLDYPTPILEDTTLNFPSELYGVTLTYTSDNEAVINPATGIVDASSLTEQATVTITVEATRGAVTNSKTIVIKVGELTVTDITDVLTESEGTFKLQGIVIAGEYQNTYFIQDSTGNIALYTDGNATIEAALEENIGNVVEIVGIRDAYKGLEQIRVETVEFVEESLVPDPTNLDAIEFNSTNLMPYQGQLIELTGMLVQDASSDSYGNIYITLENPLNGSTIEVKWDSRVELPTDLNTAIQSVAAGEVVNIVAVLGWSDGPLVYITTTSTIEEVELTEEQKLAADKAQLNFGGNVYEATTVTLPATGEYGSAITWEITTDAGSNASISEGVLTLTEVSAEATVEITATLTLGTLEETAVFTYTLMNVTKVDLGDFTSQTLGDVVAVQGVVYAITSNGLFIQDDTGKLFVYSYDAEYNLGDEVELIGEVAEYNGSYQLSNLIGLPVALTTGNDYDQTPIIYEHGVTTLVPGETYTIIGTVAIEGDYDNVFIYVNATDAFEVYYRSPSDSIDALEALVGEEVVVNMIYYNNGSVFVYTGGTEGVGVLINGFSELYAMTDGTNYDIPLDTQVAIQGVVTANSYDGLFLQDANGVGFFMYKPDETDINVGDEVIYFGAIDEYKDARQLGYGAELIDVVSTGNTLVVNTMTADEIIALDGADAGKLISFDGLTVSSYDGNDVIFDVIGTEATTQVKLRYYGDFADWLQDVYAVGDTLPAVEFVLYNFRDGIIHIDMLEIELTDAQALALDAAGVPETLELAEDMEIPVGDYGSTFTVTGITGDAATYIDYTTTPGTILVTQPAIGEPDATGVITVEVSLGTETPVVETINVTVLAEVEQATGEVTELFISEYGEGSSNNKWIEIYNGTGQDIDLTPYSVELYSNGTTTATQTLDLTGTLLAGEVYVIYNSGAVQTIIDAGDVASSVTYFNGDDALALINNGTVIDVIGVIGEDPGSSWTVGTGSTGEYTLVRADNVYGPNATFDETEWDVYPQDTFDYIGFHEVAALITELFISEYVEGSSNNKYIEIYNGTGQDIDLTPYSVELYSNGTTTATQTLDLTGTLLAGEVYVIYNSGAVQTIIDAGDVASSVTYFNGDDALALINNGTVIDVIGVIGEDPGSSWTVGTGSTGEYTLVRNSSVIGPNATFDPTEWDVYAQDTFDYIGTHTTE